MEFSPQVSVIHSLHHCPVDSNDSYFFPEVEDHLRNHLKSLRALHKVRFLLEKKRRKNVINAFETELGMYSMFLALKCYDKEEGAHCLPKSWGGKGHHLM